MNVRRLIFAVIILAIGGLWLANVYDLVDMSWVKNIEIGKVWIPAVIILVGLKALYDAFSCRRPTHFQDGFEPIEPTRDCRVVFGGRSMQFNGQTFEGLNVSATFGGAKIDLRGAEIKDGATIRANAQFGGVEIYLPQGVSVEVRSNCFLGGIADERFNGNQPSQARILLDANCMFGGVTLK